MSLLSRLGLSQILSFQCVLYDAWKFELLLIHFSNVCHSTRRAFKFVLFEKIVSDIFELSICRVVKIRRNGDPIVRLQSKRQKLIVYDDHSAEVYSFQDAKVFDVDCLVLIYLCVSSVSFIEVPYRTLFVDRRLWFLHPTVFDTFICRQKVGHWVVRRTGNHSLETLVSVDALSKDSSVWIKHV